MCLFLWTDFFNAPLLSAAPQPQGLLAQTHHSSLGPLWAITCLESCCNALVYANQTWTLDAEKQQCSSAASPEQLFCFCFHSSFISCSYADYSYWYIWCISFYHITNVTNHLMAHSCQVYWGYKESTQTLETSSSHWHKMATRSPPHKLNIAGLLLHCHDETGGNETATKIKQFSVLFHYQI